MSQAAVPIAVAHPDRKVFAVLVLLIGIGLGNIQDAFLKQLSGAYPFHQMQTLRTAIGLVLTAGWLFWRHGRGVLKGTFAPVLVARGLFLGLGSMCFYLGLAAMTMADAVSLYFALPLIVVVLSGTVLREHVPAWRWLAAAAGFVGVAVMLRPTAALFDWASLLPLTASFFYALGNLLTRRVDRSLPPMVTAFYAALSFLAVSGLVAVVFGGGAFATDVHPSLAFLTRGWAMPTMRDGMVIGLIGVMTFICFYAYAEAYRLAPPSFVAPYEYSALVWAAGLGFLFFGDLPTMRMLIGSAIIIAAGLFLALAERRTARP
ncbi:MAG: DMT family transporter [Rhizobiaceae bacterium]